MTVALLVDPMLATGGSAVRACEILKAAGVPRLKLLSLIAAPEGIARVNEAMPDVTIHVGAVDERLNEVGFIYPGLGDAGDRQFATGRGGRTSMTAASGITRAHPDRRDQASCELSTSSEKNAMGRPWSRRRSPRWSRGSRPARSPIISGRRC